MSRTATTRRPAATVPARGLFVRWGAFTYRRRWQILIASVIFMAFAGVWGTHVVSALSNGGFNDPAAASTKAANLIDKYVPTATADAIVIYSAPPGSGLTVDSTVFRQAVTAVSASLPTSEVRGFLTYWNSHQNPAFVTRDHKTTYAVVKLVGTTDTARQAAYAKVKGLLLAKGLVTQRGGSQPISDSINSTVKSDLKRAETLSFIALGILLVIVFGSLVSASLPLAIGGLAILGAFTTLRVLTYFTSVSVFAVNIITMLGLGLAIDYGLFVVSRFREQLAAGDDVETAVAHTVSPAGRTVLFSGTTVAVALGAMLLFPQNFLRSMGLGGIAAVVVAMIAALTTLPALLSVLGSRVDAGRMPWYHRAQSAQLSDTGAWARIGAFVMRRPIVVVVSTVAVLALLGVPFFKVTFGGIDERALPTSSEARVATELANKDFPRLSSTPINVVVEHASAAGSNGLQSYAARLATLPGANGAAVVALPAGASHDVAVVALNYRGESTDLVARNLVRDVRAAAPPSGTVVSVGGRSAELVDLLASLRSHLIPAALYLAIATFVLLFFAFGSIVLPLKAIVMNVLSLSATFGVLVWGFQEGHLSGLLGFTSTGTLEATQPILILALAFGLSMDYEVFLLSRMREEWDATHDNKAAVQHGLQRTGRIITSAAALFVVVVAAFSTSGITFIKMIGVGLVVAVIVDATIVRTLLVPATMALLGDWNWWLPAPLERFWRRFGIREGESIDITELAETDGVGAQVVNEPATMKV